MPPKSSDDRACALQDSRPHQGVQCPPAASPVDHVQPPPTAGSGALRSADRYRQREGQDEQSARTMGARRATEIADSGVAVIAARCSGM